MRLSDIRTKDITLAGNGTVAGKVTDALFDVETGGVRYWLLDLGGHFTHRPVLLAPEKVRLSSRALVLDVTQIDLERARKRALRLPAKGVDVGAWPSLLTGPFGNSVAPSVLASYVNAAKMRLTKNYPVLRNMPTSWRWGADLEGAPLFDAVSELGAIAELEINVSRQELSFFLVEDGAGKQSRIGHRRLRHVPQKGAHLVVTSEPTDLGAELKNAA